MAEKTPSTEADGIVTAALVVIGDEILSGRTKDRNIGHVAATLTEVGIELAEVRIVPDQHAAIVEAVNTLRQRNTYVFTTGGIGPTHDDITADAVAAAFGVSIDIDPRAIAIMEPYYAAKGTILEGARLRMARIPDGADLVANDVSGAPGFMIENVVVMAGIPDIMQSMLSTVLPRLRKGQPVRSVTIELEHPESRVSDLLRETQNDFPDVPMGSYPFVRQGRYCTNLVLRSSAPERLEMAHDRLRERLSDEGLMSRS